MNKKVLAFSSLALAMVLSIGSLITLGAGSPGEADAPATMAPTVAIQTENVSTVPAAVLGIVALSMENTAGEVRPTAPEVMPIAVTTAATDDAAKTDVAKTEAKTGNSGKVSVNATAASVLGTTEEVLATSLNGGSSLYKLLTDAGKLAEFKTALISAKQEMMDAKVASGKYDAAAAAQKMATYTQTINDWDGTTELSLGWGFKSKTA